MKETELAEVIKWFRLTAPEYDSVEDTAIANWVEFLEPFISKKQFRDLYTRAFACLIAHRMKWKELYILNGSDGMAVTSGQLTSQHEGDLSLSYGSTSNGSDGFTDDLDKTVYGIMYKRYRRWRVIPVMTRYG